MAETGKLIIKIGANSDAYKKELDLVKNQTANFEKGLASLSKVSAVAFAGLAASIGVSVKQFAKFDNELRGVKTLLNETSFGAEGLEKGFAEMRKEILAVGKTSAVEISSLNKSLFDTVSAGIDASKAVEVVGISAKLAVAGLTDVSVSTDGITSALNAYGLSADKAEIVASKFFAAQVQGKTTISELSRFFGRTAASASAYGISLDELLGAVAATTTAGIKTAAAFTGLNAVMANVAKPTKEASAEAKRLGITFNSTALRTHGLKGFLDKLTSSQNFNKTSIEKLFGSVQAQKIAFSLTGAQAGKFADNIKILSDEQANLNLFTKAYETQSGSLENSFKVLRNNVSALGIVIGEQFAPTIQLVTEALAKFFSKMTDSPILAKSVALFLALGTGVAGLTAALAIGAQAFLAIRAAMLAANIQVNVMKFGIRGLVGATGLGLLLIVGYEIYANWNTIWPAMQETFTKWGNATLEVLEDVINFFIWGFNTIATSAMQFGRAYISIWSGIATTVFNIGKNLGKVLLGVFTLDTDKIKEGITGAKDAIVNGAKDTMAEVKNDFNSNTEPLIAPVKLGRIDVKEIEKTLPPVKVDIVSTTQASTTTTPAPPKTSTPKPEKLDGKSQERIQKIKDELEIIEEMKIGASDKEIAFIKRGQELEIAERKAGAEKNAVLRDAEVSLVKAQQEKLLADRDEYELMRAEQIAEAREADNLLRDENVIEDQEFLLTLNETELEGLRNQMLSKEEIEKQFAMAKVQRQIKERNDFLKAEAQHGKAFATLQGFFNSQEVQGALKATGMLVGMQNSKNKTLAGIGKAAALTQIAINTPRGALDAYSAMASIPFIGPALGAVAAGAVIAYGAEQAGAVLSANKGGMVPVNIGTAGKDSVAASLTPGELITPAQNFDEVIGSVRASRNAQTAGGETSGGGGGGAMIPLLQSISSKLDILSAPITINGDVLDSEPFVDDLLERIRDATSFRNGAV